MRSSAQRAIAAVCAWLCLGALGYAGSTPAQETRIADLGISATLTPSGPLRPGSTARLVLTFTNHGPEDAPSVGAVSSGYVFLHFAIFVLAPALPQPCAMQFTDFLSPPSQPSYLVAGIRAGALPAGASRICTLDLIVLPNATGVFDLSFQVRDARVFITDANPANNSVLLRLAFAPAEPPEVIPATGWSAWLLLLGCVLVGGILEGRRRA